MSRTHYTDLPKPQKVEQDNKENKKESYMRQRSSALLHRRTKPITRTEAQDKKPTHDRLRPREMPSICLCDPRGLIIFYECLYAVPKETHDKGSFPQMFASRRRDDAGECVARGTSQASPSRGFGGGRPRAGPPVLPNREGFTDRVASFCLPWAEGETVAV